MNHVVPKNPTPSTAGQSEQQQPAGRYRFRIRFAKVELLRWISHRDLARLWERMIRRANFPLSMTEGFHPKPRISFPSALSLGMESLDEVVELEFTQDLDESDVLQRLCDDRQPGLSIDRVTRMPEGSAKAQLERAHYHIHSPAFDGDGNSIEIVCEDEIHSAIETLAKTEIIEVARKKKTIKFDRSSEVIRFEATPNGIEMELAAGAGASLKPSDVLVAAGLGHWNDAAVRIVRTRCELQNDEQTENRTHPSASTNGQVTADRQSGPTP
ncbi:MAG: TIGR03936 family radical SAM-associated protein [Planctomycetota bacterium]